ncbi:hypothetical protein VCHA53O466_40210 [Vibrio chagasii]|nr:hypothetical protein VCHA53O466_40210 [Vibrio chagasii]
MQYLFEHGTELCDEIEVLIEKNNSEKVNKLEHLHEATLTCLEMVIYTKSTSVLAEIQRNMNTIDSALTSIKKDEQS